jgi:hypothetical protein
MRVTENIGIRGTVGGPEGRTLCRTPSPRDVLTFVQSDLHSRKERGIIVGSPVNGVPYPSRDRGSFHIGVGGEGRTGPRAFVWRTLLSS